MSCGAAKVLNLTVLTQSKGVRQLITIRISTRRKIATRLGRFRNSMKSIHSRVDCAELISTLKKDYDIVKCYSLNLIVFGKDSSDCYIMDLLYRKEDT